MAGSIRVRNRRGELVDAPQYTASEAKHRFGQLLDTALRHDLPFVAVVGNGGTVGKSTVRAAMDDSPLTCTPETEIDEVRRMMLGRHARYTPVMNQGMLMGVISFFDVAKAVVDAQDFENRMLKAYIRDWPVEEPGAGAAAAPN